MSTTTAIEWTDATWNPVTGCTKGSGECDNCYAEWFADRFRGALNPQWMRDIRDHCVGHNVPSFFKQWGGLRPKSGGLRLDGREWDEFPATLEA